MSTDRLRTHQQPTRTAGQLAVAELADLCRVDPALFSRVVREADRTGQPAIDIWHQQLAQHGPPPGMPRHSLPAGPDHR